jgi:hypothetical protein
MYRYLKLLLICLLAFTPAALLAKPLPFSANYVILQDGNQVGSASRELLQLENGQWQMTTKSEARLLFVKVILNQDVVFKWQNNRALPITYEQLSDTSLSSKRRTKQYFDWDAMTDTGSYKDRTWELELNENSYSELTDIIQLQEQLKTAGKPVSDLAFLVNNRGDSKTEAYQYEANETLTTSAGSFETWRYKKIHSNPKRQSLYWFAPELDYQPIRIQQFADGNEQANMVLESIEFK